MDDGFPPDTRLNPLDLLDASGSSVTLSVSEDGSTKVTLAMKPVIARRTIKAPLELVFQTIADPRNFQSAVPHIKEIEFLTDQHSGRGTRFRETRVMHGREESVVLEVTDYSENESVRIVSDAGGTVWDSVFTVSEGTGGIDLNLRMDMIPHTWKARITTRLIRGFVAKGVEADMDAVKAHCETTD